MVIHDIEISNQAVEILGEDYSAPHKMNRTGVAVVAKDKGVRSGITLRNLSIHDVNGNVYDKHMNNGGIYMTALKPADEKATGVARFKDITVEAALYTRQAVGESLLDTPMHMTNSRGRNCPRIPF